MTGLGKILILLGGVFIVIGLVLVFAPRIPFIGKLPGDIHIKRDSFEVYIPLATCLLLSIIASAIMWAIGYLGRK
jgi:hypothetical protein